MAPADAAELLGGMVGDQVEDEVVDSEDPLVLLAGVGIAAADDDEVEEVRVGKVAWPVGRVEEGEGGAGGDGGDGADVRVADLGDEGGSVRVEQDGDVEWPEGGDGVDSHVE